jgi:hypothetical protein
VRDVGPHLKKKEGAGRFLGWAILLWEFLFGKAFYAVKMNDTDMATRPSVETGNIYPKGGQVIECFR